MVFKEIFGAWKKKSLLSKSLDELKLMLVKDKLMFKEANEVLFQGKKTGMDFYKQDREINQHEMNIRRMILEHFAINPSYDINAFLILLIANKDIERLGDYGKNIIELAYLHKKPLEGSRYVVTLIKAQESLERMFDLTEKAFFETNKEKGKQVISHHKQLARQLDIMIEEIVNDKKIDKKKAIICCLAARYFKRVSAHLRSTARVAVVPFDKFKVNKPISLPMNVPAWKSKNNSLEI